MVMGGHKTTLHIVIVFVCVGVRVSLTCLETQSTLLLDAHRGSRHTGGSVCILDFLIRVIACCCAQQTAHIPAA